MPKKSLILTKDELLTITGKQLGHAQKKRLKAMGIPFIGNDTPVPLVLRADAEKCLSAVTPTWKVSLKASVVERREMSRKRRFYSSVDDRLRRLERIVGALQDYQALREATLPAKQANGGAPAGAEE